MPISLEEISQFARVPEHGLSLVQTISGGRPLLMDDYLFYHGEDWLSAIGYPLRGKHDNVKFHAALKKAVRQTRAVSCFAIGPALPESLQSFIVEKDHYYLLGVNARSPKKLKNPVEKARNRLDVTETSQFTPQHRQLWAEFIQRSMTAQGSPMNARVRELYAKTPFLFRTEDGNIKFLDARDPQGNLVATLLLDFSAKNFTAYILGAHSRKFYVPHAHDLLFHEMIALSKAANKKYVHLGLGVNEGIARFKLKWGGKASLPYLFAQWEEKSNKIHHVLDNLDDDENVGRTLALAIMHYESDVSPRKILGEDPERKPFAMLWQVEKNGALSWLAGTAHFFRYSFEPSFRSLFKKVDNVIFEGPLDADFMNNAAEAGRRRPKEMKPLIEELEETDIVNLEKVVWGRQGKIYHALGMTVKNRLDVRGLLQNSSPWHAFFSLWAAFLERIGWKYSVDMEAWRTAMDMNKNIVAMETLEEQLAALASLPVERVTKFFKNSHDWKARANRNLRAYLSGDLEEMMGSSAEFPTRTEYVVGRRDQRFRERMRPYLEEGNSAVFVGAAHLVNLRQMLVEDGFTVIQKPYGLLPKIKLKYRNLRKKKEVKW